MAVSCLTLGAFAAANNQTISALLSYSTPIVFNGQPQTFKDASGKQVFPILYEGTTYLPVRAICGLAGIAVDYDASTGTVVLGEKDKTPVTSAVWVNRPSIWAESSYTLDMTQLVFQGEAHSEGIVCKSTTSGGPWDAGYFKLDGKYTTLSVTACCTEGDATLYFKETSDNKSTTYKTCNLKEGVPVTVDVPVSGLQSLYVHLQSSGKNIILTDMYLK